MAGPTTSTAKPAAPATSAAAGAAPAAQSTPVSRPAIDPQQYVVVTKTLQGARTYRQGEVVRIGDMQRHRALVRNRMARELEPTDRPYRAEDGRLWASEALAKSAQKLESTPPSEEPSEEPTGAETEGSA